MFLSSSAQPPSLISNLGFSSWFFNPYLAKFNAKIMELMKLKMMKIGKDDPRRIIHSFKVGLALTMVSIFYYVTPLFIAFGVSAMWAVLTVVVVMEYTVGATLSKGVNRVVATFLGGALGIGAHWIESHCGEKGQAIVLGIFVFLLAALATYSRFIPKIRARYDYGMVIFILTFSLVAVSSYRVDELIELAHQRLSTVALGVAICLLCSLFVFPVWAGEELHNLVAANLEKLATSLKVIGEEYFGGAVGIGDLEGKSTFQDYNSVLNSKAIGESLANLARWEPGHGRFGFCHPWKQYLKIGALIRQCAYSLEALRNYIIKTKATKESVPWTDISSTCTIMTTESINTLTQLATSIRSMTAPLSTTPHIDTAIAATIGFKDALSRETSEVSQVLELAVVALLLTDVVQNTQRIAVAVQELSGFVGFERSDPIPGATVRPVDEEGGEVAVELEE